MAINLKTIAILCIALQLFYSCKPHRIKTITNGKNVAVNFVYNNPFKLGDTVWVDYKCKMDDLTSIDETILKNDFSRYTATMSSSFSLVTFNNNIVNEDIGEYIKVTNNFPNFQIMLYNNTSQIFESKFGFVPNKKGKYMYQVSAILLQPDNNTTDNWALKTHFVGDNPADSVIRKDFEVE